MKNLIVGDAVEVTGGKWVGHTGVIVKVANRNDGKAGYKIHSDSGDYIHCLEKFVVPAKHLKFKDTNTVKESFERKWVRVKTLKNVVTQSKDPKNPAKNLSQGKNVLVTDEWEEDDKTLVNVVFQGNFAVLPKEDVEVSESQNPGLV